MACDFFDAKKKSPVSVVNFFPTPSQNLLKILNRLNIYFLYCILGKNGNIFNLVKQFSNISWTSNYSLKTKRHYPTNMYVFPITLSDWVGLDT